jgi:XTP/dITP diphosphohydrolase
MIKLTYVTGNWAKVESAKKVLEPLGIKVKNVKMPTTEIQADTVSEVAKFSAKEASEKLRCNVLKNDTGLFVEALGGFPGAYTHYVDETIGEDGLLKLLEGKTNRNAMFVEAYAYAEYGKEPVVFKSITHGTIATEKSGKFGWSWDFVFIPEGQTKTLANFPDEERWLMWNTDGFVQLAEFLKSKQGS